MTSLLAAGACLLATLASCGPATAQVSKGMDMKLTSSAFANNGVMPDAYTCSGRGLSPPLTWEGIPAGTRSLALIVDDPDAPDPAAPQRIWVHWVLYNLPVGGDGLAEGIAAGDLPAGSAQGRNDWHRTGYGPPCPPVGRHRYFFKLYALGTVLPDLKEPSRSELEAAMRGHVIGQAVLMGTYEKKRSAH